MLKFWKFIMIRLRLIQETLNCFYEYLKAQYEVSFGQLSEAEARKNMKQL